MRITIERLRRWIAVAGVLAVIAIVAVFFYARHRVRLFGRDLPARLGLQIQQSTNGFTVSRSKGGHTQFVLHASKEIQYKGAGKKGGEVVLKDVDILIYSPDGSRADKLSGSQFNYDPNTGIARAIGPVEIEMAPPTSGSSGKQTGNRIQVKTSGVVFDQKSQVVTTDDVVTFSDGVNSGSARGATYDSGRGTLELSNDVVLHALAHGGPVTVKAQGAVFDRGQRQLVLIKGYVVGQGDNGTADQATVFFNKQGDVDHLTAQGNVHALTENGTDVHGSNANIQWNDDGQLKQVRLGGGVLLVATKNPGSPGRSGNASAPAEVESLHATGDSATLNFTAGNLLRHLEMLQAVSVVDAQQSIAGDPHGSETRELTASKLEVDLLPQTADSAGHTKTLAKDVLASGGASVTVHTIHANAPQQSTTLKGDQLFATLVDGHLLSTLRGDGHTYLLLNSPGGVSQSSTADSLMVRFAPAPEKATRARPSTQGASGGLANLASAQGSQVESAVQRGHATLVELQPATTPGGAPVKTTATANLVSFEGSSGNIELTGGTPRIQQQDSSLSAATIDFNRTTGDANAAGGVKATYDQPADGPMAKNVAVDAIHVAADRATLNHGKDTTTFFGSAHENARLWDGPNSILAPAIEVSRTRQLLTAQGAASGVTATFVDAGDHAPGSIAPGKSGNAVSPTASGVLKVVSSSFAYSGGERKASFNGDVTASSQSGLLRANSLDVYLTPQASGTSAKADRANTPAPPMSVGLVGPSGQVDRIIATGRVSLRQGDRKATGEKLVYTTADGKFVLTGSSAFPPRVTDPAHGSVTGASLIFNNRDDSVIVSRGQSATVTDTRTSK